MGKKIVGIDVNREISRYINGTYIPRYENLELRKEVYLGIAEKLAKKKVYSKAAEVCLELTETIQNEAHTIKNKKYKEIVLDEDRLKILEETNKLLNKIGSSDEGSSQIGPLWSSIEALERYISDYGHGRYNKPTTIGGRSKLEKTVTTGILAIIGGVFLLSPNITGNSIAGINSKITTGSGIIFLICGLLIGFLYFRTKK